MARLVICRPAEIFPTGICSPAAQLGDALDHMVIDSPRQLHVAPESTTVAPGTVGQVGADAPVVPEATQRYMNPLVEIGCTTLPATAAVEAIHAPDVNRPLEVAKLLAAVTVWVFVPNATPPAV